MKKFLIVLLGCAYFTLFAACSAPPVSQAPVSVQSLIHVEVASQPTRTFAGAEKEIINEKEPIVSDAAPVVEPHEQQDDVIEKTSPSELTVQEACPDETSSSIFYNEVNETVYAKSAVNIRIGPGTKYKKVGVLRFGQSIVRIGIGDNNWSKVLYNGFECYISSNYLTTEEPHSETVLEEMNRRGNVGRLSIPSVGVNVALFDVSIYNGSAAQAVVDRTDSAAYISDAEFLFGFILIGDHRNQGFDNIKKSVVGTTYAYIDFGTYIKSYICTDKFVGLNIGKDILTMDGESIANMNDNGITMYTCNTDDTITITFWQPN